MKNNIKSIKLQKLLLSHSFFRLGRFVFIVFMNIFIWKLTGSLRAVAIYNIVTLIAHTVSFSLFAYLIKEGKINLVRITGLIGAILITLLIYILKEESVNFLIPIGIIRGFTNGMYWISYHVTRFDLTNNHNRGNYAGLENATQKIIKIAAPALGGFLISINLLNMEYGVIFLSGAIFYLLALITGINRLPEHKPGKLHLAKTISVIKNNKDIIKIFASNAVYNLGRKGAIEHLLPILIFHTINSELQLGGWLALFALISALTSFITGKYINYGYYKKAANLAGAILFLSFLSLIGLPNILTYVIFGFFWESASPILHIAKQVYSENLIHTMPNHKSHRIEYIVIKEWFLIGMGRIGGFVLLLFAESVEDAALKIILLIMSASIILEPILINRIKTNIAEIRTQ